MPTALIQRFALFLALGISAALSAPAAFAQAEQRALVSSAALTFSSFLGDRDMGALKRDLGQAKAVMIAPEIAKAGFIVGGAGGRAVVVARNLKSGKWVGPAFYTLELAILQVLWQRGPSTVRQIHNALKDERDTGYSTTLKMVQVMTDKGLDKLLSDHFSLGGDVGIAAGPVGANSRTYLLADFITYSRSQGVYVGVNLDGSVVTTSDDWNQLYYGRAVLASDILVRQQVQNRHANELLNLVAGAAK